MKTFERVFGDRTFHIEQVAKWTGRTYRTLWQWRDVATDTTSEAFRLKREAVQSAMREVATNTKGAPSNET